MKRLTLLPITSVLLCLVVISGCAREQVITETVYIKSAPQQHKEPILPPAPKAQVPPSQPEENTPLKPIYARVTNDSNCTVSVRLLFLPEPKMAVYLPTFLTLLPGNRAVYKMRLGTTHVGLQFKGQNIIYFEPHTKYRNAIIYPLPAPGEAISLPEGMCATVLRGLETPYSWSFE